jgi:Beta-xylosidase
MKKTLSIFWVGISSLFLSANGFGQSSRINTFVNPVIPGDHSDCTLTKIGDHFYTTGSSFNPTPVIYHSMDLVHWEAVAQPVSAAWAEYGDSPGAGCWGGQIVYYKGKYWDFFSHGGTMCFVTADKVEGPWSLPTRMKNPSQLPYPLGYDNSVFIDDDGKWYLVVKNGQPNNGIVELGDDGQAIGVVYDLKWLNPESKNFPFSWAEGPVMWKDNGYYYYSCARDVAGGQKVIRSKSLTTDPKAWTEPVDLFNENAPDKTTAIFHGPNHCSAAVKLKDGTSWLLHPVWARANNGEWFGQGRQGLLNQVTYRADGCAVADYPTNEPKIAPTLASGGISWMVPKSDFFTTDKLNPEWSFLGYTPVGTFSLTVRPGWLRLHPKSSTKANTVIKTDPEHNYSLITRVDFKAQTVADEAGIRVINGKENLFVKLYSTKNKQGQNVVSLSFDSVHYDSKPVADQLIWLKLIRENHQMTGYYSQDGNDWTPVGAGINVASLDSYNVDFNGWSANRQGLYVQGTQPADFDLYIYRDAYTPVLAECPANQFGTKRTAMPNGKFRLDEIHNNDWALYAGVEFGDVDYKKTPATVEFLASSGTKGGIIEIWLDSIGSGKNIATCKIGNTGGASVFKQFSAKVLPTIGRHDVYLRFKGDAKAELFALQSFQFISANLSGK